MKNLLRRGALVITAFALSATASLASSTDKAKEASAVYEYQIDGPHTEIGFKVRHLGIANVTGRFDEHEVSLELDPNDLTTLRTSTSIRTSSVNTGIEKRDNHLRSDDFFNAQEYPEITFVSREVTDVDSDGTFKLHGDLTIRDVTKPIVLDAEFRGPVAAAGTERIAFSAEADINRFDYNLKWNKLIESGGLVVSESVRLVIEVEALRELETGATN
jgi:polyisoprenoid-binding protein YceI